MKNSEQPIHPCRISNGSPLGDWAEYGLTKREYFAAMAMNGVLSMYSDPNSISIDELRIAKISVKLSDAPLKELENKS